MNLEEAVDVLRAGGGFTNPVTAENASLVAKRNIISSSAEPNVSTFHALLGSFLSTSVPIASNAVAGLSTNLPLMTAVNDILNRIYSTTGETTTFAVAFSPLTVVKARMAAIDTAVTTTDLTRFATYDEFNVITPEDITLIASLTSQVNTAASIVSSTGAASAAAINDSYSLLRAYSFANFGTGTKPAYIENIFNLCVTARVDE